MGTFVQMGPQSELRRRHRRRHRVQVCHGWNINDILCPAWTSSAALDEVRILTEYCRHSKPSEVRQAHWRVSECAYDAVTDTHCHPDRGLRRNGAKPLIMIVR